MIKPHGADTLKPLYVSDAAARARLTAEAANLPALLISSAAAGNAVMLAAGYFTPLNGFMNLADSLSVAEKLHTTAGLFWPVPIVNMVKDVTAIKGAKPRGASCIPVLPDSAQSSIAWDEVRACKLLEFSKWLESIEEAIKFRRPNSKRTYRLERGVFLEQRAAFSRFRILVR